MYLGVAQKMQAKPSVAGRRRLGLQCRVRTGQPLARALVVGASASTGSSACNATPGSPCAHATQARPAAALCC
jgi:hypothetical protein